MRWKIHKFGGSSLADAECFRRVAGIVLAMPDNRLGVVVSAMGGMTDALINLAVLAERDDDAYKAELDAVGERYAGTARELLEGDSLVGVLDAWSADAADIRDVLKAVALVKSAPQRSRDVVAGYGEIWSARLLAAYLGQEAPERGGVWVDARHILIVRETELGPTVLWEASQAKFDDALARDFEGIAVITGFIATDEDGLQTTLGRNGSDYSAAIFASLANAAELSIWTDVDGVMSADPNRVPEARVIDQMTYNEAMELAYFGAKVIHPATLGPAVDNDIPVIIRSSLAALAANLKGKIDDFTCFRVANNGIPHVDAQRPLLGASRHPQPLVVFAEGPTIDPVGEVEVADGPAFDLDGHAEEGAHHGVTGRITDAARVARDVIHAHGRRLAQARLEDLAGPGLVGVTDEGERGERTAAHGVDIRERVSGGAEKVRESGAVVVGGHSVQDAEIKFGYAVTGLVDSDQAFAGFSNGAVITVWAMFILSEGLTRTGIADIIGILGGYVVGTTSLGFNSAAYIKNTTDFVEFTDLL